MKNLLKLALTYLVLTACAGGSGSSDSSGIQSPITTTPVQVLPGDSQFSKIADGLYIPTTNYCGFTQGKGYYKLVLSKHLGEFSIIRTYYSDHCLTQTISEALVYSFVSANTVQGVEITSLKVIDAQLALLDNSLVAGFNSQQTYGLSWVYGIAQSVINTRPQPNQEITYVSDLVIQFEFEIQDSQKFKLMGLTFNKQ